MKLLLWVELCPWSYPPQMYAKVGHTDLVCQRHAWVGGCFSGKWIKRSWAFTLLVACEVSKNWVSTCKFVKSEKLSFNSEVVQSNTLAFTWLPKRTCGLSEWVGGENDLTISYQRTILMGTLLQSCLTPLQAHNLVVHARPVLELQICIVVC